MTSSLVQILTKDVSNLYLNSSNGGTFFKTSQPKHYSFAQEYTEESFNYEPNFDEEGFCELSKKGDLISSVFLKVVIPNVELKIPNEDLGKFTDYSTTPINNGTYNLTPQEMVNQYQSIITSFKTFTNSAMVVWRLVHSESKSNTSTYKTIQIILADFSQSYNDVQSVYNANNTFQSTVIGDTGIEFNFDLINHISGSSYSSEYGVSHYNKELTIKFKQVLEKYLNDYIFYQRKYLKWLIEQRDFYSKLTSKTHYKFAWVPYVGCKLIERVEIEIGGRYTDVVTGSEIYNHLMSNIPKTKSGAIDRMLGFIPSLVQYDSSMKPSQTLFIPLTFWFEKFKQLSLPIVSMRYSNIVLKCKLAPIDSCCIFEPTFQGTYSSELNLSEKVRIEKISLLIEYVYLMDSERILYAQNKYLSIAEQHQNITYEIDNTSKKSVFSLEFNGLVHKYTWQLQRKSLENTMYWNRYSNTGSFRGYIGTLDQDTGYLVLTLDFVLSTWNKYLDGFCEIEFSEYYNGTYKIHDVSSSFIIIRPVTFTENIYKFKSGSGKYIYPDYFMFTLKTKYNRDISIINNEFSTLYNEELQRERSGEYFKQIQQFMTQERYIPNLHVQTFSLYPSKIYQPSGHLNMGVIPGKKLHLDLNQDVLAMMETNGDKYILSINSLNYNMLQCNNGYGGIIF